MRRAYGIEQALGMRRSREANGTGPAMILDPFPARPWSARSLVGMSMGARKRAALAEVADRAILVNPPTSYLYHLHRQRYRIGERLRPCRFCRGPELFARCLGERIAVDVMGAHVKGECVFCRTCIDAAKTLRFANPDACDGSGLLPAKRKGGAA